MSRPLLLSVPFDTLPLSAVIDRIRSMLSGSIACHVATPNNEMLVLAQRNPEFLRVLQSTALNIVDSTGVALALRFHGNGHVVRTPGIDVLTQLCTALPSDIPVFFLGAGEGIAARAAQALKSMNPSLTIAGTYAGSPRDDEAVAIIQRINASGAALLLVAYGAPLQELWIAKHLHALTSVRVAMGVGGSFDFLAGSIHRAPSVLRAIGLEWLWRFNCEPSRYRRMWNAVVVFPWLLVRGALRVTRHENTVTRHS